MMTKEVTIPIKTWWCHQWTTHKQEYFLYFSHWHLHLSFSGVDNWPSCSLNLGQPSFPPLLRSAAHNHSYHDTFLLNLPLKSHFLRRCFPDVRFLIIQVVRLKTLVSCLSAMLLTLASKDTDDSDDHDEHYDHDDHGKCIYQLSPSKKCIFLKCICQN